MKLELIDEEGRVIQNRLQQLTKRLVWVGDLLTKSQFWDAIGDPLTNSEKLDTSLATVCYGCLLASQLIRYRPQMRATMKKVLYWVCSRLIKVLQPIIRKSKKLSVLCYKLMNFLELGRGWPGEKELNAANTQTSKILKSISTYISDVRIFNRMWAMPSTIGYLISGLKTVAGQRDTSKAMKLFEVIDIVAIVLYQPLENLAFANDHGWTYNGESLASALTDYYYNTSSVMWGVYLVIEVGKLMGELWSCRNGEASPGLKRAMLSNVVNIPLSYHWALPEGCFGDFWVGLLGLIASLPDTARVWSEVGETIKRL